ncbi:hypothetical protein KIL84_003777 [Mauremys mutica]|uniref:Uncharacterized protein n=1 Tax=Mauremys mutica TaxID=74926 RepID=A0A9D3WQ32_9SAUR|nr:hypothetical protein KIL84_003777 [Mauremys mutica]
MTMPSSPVTQIPVSARACTPVGVSAERVKEPSSRQQNSQGSQWASDDVNGPLLPIGQLVLCAKLPSCARLCKTQGLRLKGLCGRQGSPFPLWTASSTARALNWLFHRDHQPWDKVLGTAGTPGLTGAPLPPRPRLTGRLGKLLCVTVFAGVRWFDSRLPERL